MKIGEYEQMMSYLTRPAAETRENFEDGSGPLAGLDRKTREPGKGIKKIKIESVEENIKKITYLNKETGKTIDIYKALISDAPKKIDGKQIAGVGGDYKTLLSKRLGYNSDLFLITKIDTLYFNKNTSPPPAPKYSNNNGNIFII